MKKTKRIKKAFVLGLVIVVSFVFVIQAVGLAQKSPYQGITLRVIGPRWTQVMAFEEVGKEIAEEMGMKLDFTFLDWEDAANKVLMDAKVGLSTWDIVAFTGIQFAELVESGVLYPLDPFIYDYNIADPYKLMLEDFSPVLIENAKYKGKLYTFEGDNAVPALCYRTDLFNSPIEKKNFKAKYGYELKPPETYKEYYDIAEFFTRKADEKLDGKVLEEDFYGIAHSSKKGSVLWHDYVSFMLAFGADLLWDPETMMPTWNSPENIEAMEFYKSITKFQPSGYINLSSGEATALNAAGKLAMQIEFSGDVWAQVSDPAASKVLGKVALALPPSQPGVKGREHAAINAVDGFGIYGHSEHKEAAYKLIEEYFSPQRQKEVSLKYNIISARLSVLRDPEVRVAPPAVVMGEVAKEAYVFCHGRVPEYAQAVDIATDEFHKALSGQKTIEEAAADGQKRLVELFREAGYIK